VQPVKIFARPFDLEIHRSASSETALPATVRRVLAAGSRVKVELSGPEGENVLVEMTHDRHKELALLAGDSVYMVLRDAKVFPGSTNGKHST
jgi:sulfate transport system ATP-binding protein